jgi:hypothetical protein
VSDIYNQPSSAKHVLNWKESLLNCKNKNFKEYNATDMCELNKDIAEAGMWTNIFRVEISAHADHGNTFFLNTRIHLCSRNAKIE